MPANQADNRLTRWAGRLLAGSLLLLVGSIGLAAAMWLMPIAPDGPTIDEISRELAMADNDEALSVSDVLRQTAGRRLIRPAQIIAAVKDTGAAERLVKRLKLQGIIEMGGRKVAYVQVDGQNTVSVREGQKVLDMTVAKIESSRVEFSLDGVQASLAY